MYRAGGRSTHVSSKWEVDACIEEAMLLMRRSSYIVMLRFPTFLIVTVNYGVGFKEF